MNATRRVLLGALLGAGVTASIAAPFPGTEATFADSEQVRITVVAELPAVAELPGTRTSAARSAVAAVQQFVAAVGPRHSAAVVPVLPDLPAAPAAPALPRHPEPAEPAATQPQPAPTEPTAQPPAQPPAGPPAEPTAQPEPESADAGPGDDGGAGE